MSAVINDKNLPEKAQVELSSCLLVQLIMTGVLHGDECKCLNANAKKVLWQSLLTSSLNNERNLCV